ncbi:uncharacterized protein LOC144711613 isoform X1 [Wolffia australiana]
MESEAEDRMATKLKTNPPTAASAYQDWASAVHIFYSANPAASGNPQTFYASSPSLASFVWGTETPGSGIQHSSIFSHGSAFSRQAKPTRDGTARNVEGEDKVSEGGSSGTSDKGASATENCKESGGEESSTNRIDDDAARLASINSHGKININGQKRQIPEDFKGADESEERRQKRKQSNRESARRSRERRQKECESLARLAAELNAHNGGLRAEVDQLHAECGRVGAENASLMEQLKALYGANVLSAFEGD